MRQDEFVDLCTDLADELFPKGYCKERGQLLVFIARLNLALLDRGVITPKRRDHEHL